MTRLQLYIKCKTFIHARFADDWTAAFHHYAPDGRLKLPDLTRFLIDAKVGDEWEATAAGRAVMKRLDANADGAVDEGEFRAALAGRGK